MSKHHPQFPFPLPLATTPLALDCKAENQESSWAVGLRAGAELVCTHRNFLLSLILGPSTQVFVGQPSPEVRTALRFWALYSMK